MNRREAYYYVSEVDISERGQVWERNKAEKREKMKRELEHKKNKQCTFVPKIRNYKKSRSANKKQYNASAFLKDGLSNYFQRIDRAKKMKKGNRRKTPPPLQAKRSPSKSSRRKIRKSQQREEKYESRFRPMEMQKTDENFFESKHEELFGSSQVKLKDNRQPVSEIRNQVLLELSRRAEGSPGHSSRAKQEHVFAAHTKQLMQGLFSSNETGSFGLLGSKYNRHVAEGRINCRRRVR